MSDIAYLTQLVQTMDKAKKQLDISVINKIDGDPAAEDVQIVIEGQLFNIGSMYVDINDLIWQLFDDIQKFASKELRDRRTDNE